ncbi:MAG TPA: BrnT family toxin [Candidatus Sumerlaeota bacterium]|nr:BrnT family toxin [Candidatus Sumerlaeota bacterium]HOR28237.1 BrnT family toxin [Candidatus Sumerlaeota bacterium]HPK01709.1 BrnT family toxin [Candidatus Sumerlaeota bacterium]
MPLRFEWDQEKARSNFRKHGITFAEASTAFGDALSRTIPDPLHSEDEQRFALIGQSLSGRLLVVVHTHRAERTRSISARRASNKERQQYEKNARR